MTSTSTDTQTSTHTYTDIETVMRRFKADLVMIAQSTGGMPEQLARDYAHDVEKFAKNGYLEKVDVTLLSNGSEVRAAQYTVNTASGDLTTSRPGDVLWLKVKNPILRVIISPTNALNADTLQAMQLKINWAFTKADLSHSSLKSYGGRDYVSNGWGIQRKDFAA